MPNIDRSKFKVGFKFRVKFKKVEYDWNPDFKKEASRKNVIFTVTHVSENIITLRISEKLKCLYMFDSGDRISFTNRDLETIEIIPEIVKKVKVRDLI